MEINEVFGFGRKMGEARQGRMHTCFYLTVGFGKTVLRRQLSKGYASEFQSGSLKETASCLKVMIFERGIHGFVITEIT